MLDSTCVIACIFFSIWVAISLPLSLSLSLSFLFLFSPFHMIPSQPNMPCNFTEDSNSISHLNIPYCSVWHYMVTLTSVKMFTDKNKDLIFFALYRKDVVSLSDGVLTNVLLIWEEVRRSNHTNSFVFEEGTLHCPLS